MGIIHAEIELLSSYDLEHERRGYIKPEEVHSVKVKALVDSGASMLCINEHLKEQLDLAAQNDQEVELANGIIEKCEVAGPVEIRFENRKTVCFAVVLPGESEVLLGAIPMQDMDVVILPFEEKMVVNPANPYMPKKKVKCVMKRPLHVETEKAVQLLKPLGANKVYLF